MPLRARVDGEDVLSIDLSQSAFDALRGRQDITMPCCDARAVPKRSVTGLPFFAHDRRSGCDYAAETEFHLRGKVLIRDAAHAVGWAAQVEVPGVTPNGERWRADVLCHERARQVAFEMQHSGITLAQLGTRQARYKESNIRGMWFMRTHERRLNEPQVWQHDTPALYVTEEHHIPSLKLPLSDVVREALQGQLILFPVTHWPIRVTAVAHSYPCRWCRTITGVLARVLLAPVSQSDFFVEANWAVEGLAVWVRDVLARAGALTYPLLQRKEHKKYIGSAYDCPQCGKNLSVHSRPKNKLESWRRIATHDVPAERYPTLTVGGDFVMSRVVTFTPAEQQRFSGVVGSRWHAGDGWSPLRCRHLDTPWAN
jgi:hypothetical protein